MKDEENIKQDFIQDEELDSMKESGILRGLIDGTLLTRKKVLNQMPFVFFLVFLGLIYISNSYHAESLRTRRDILREEINELRSQAVFVSSELMKVSRQTEVADVVRQNGLDLRESTVPPKKIIVTGSKKYKKSVN